MKANIINKTIEMTTTEAKAAGIYESNEFKALRNLQAAFPDFTLEIKKSNRGEKRYRGLTIEFMENYIQSSDKENKDALLAELNTLRGKDENGNLVVGAMDIAYGKIKKWFLDMCPEIEAFSKKQDEILEKAKKKNAHANAEKEVA